jgi:hypothetical protein
MKTSIPKKPRRPLNLKVCCESESHNITESLGYPLVKAAGLIQLKKSTNYRMLLTFGNGLYDAVYKIIYTGIERENSRAGDCAETIAEDIVMTIRGLIFD